jgi:Holliday junction resolvase
MKNTAAKGARLEREILHFLNNNGYAAMRAPSSGNWVTPVDVVAIKNGRVIALECKNYKTKPRLDKDSMKRFREWCTRAGATGFLLWQIHGVGGDDAWKFLTLDDAEANRYEDSNWFTLDMFKRIL